MLLLIGGCGYVGSALFNELSKTRGVRCIDIQRRGNPGAIPHLNINYRDTSRGLLNSFDDIILLAAHSSVGESVNDPSGAFTNNVVAFQRLLEMMDDRQRLIYASSSSIYSGFGSAGASEDPLAGNMYDASKYMNDMLAGISGRRTYGLRFGTVNGPSPNLRPDLMLNKMVQSALDKGVVQIANPKVRRPILGINDLTRAITAMLDGDGAPGIYNLCSFNDTVAHLGAVVAAELDVPLILGEPSPSYDFVISADKFQQTYNFGFEESAESIVGDLVRWHGSNGRSDDAVYAPAALPGL